MDFRRQVACQHVIHGTNLPNVRVN